MLFIATALEGAAMVECLKVGMKLHAMYKGDGDL